MGERKRRGGRSDPAPMSRAKRVSEGQTPRSGARARHRAAPRAGAARTAQGDDATRTPTTLGDVVDRTAVPSAVTSATQQTLRLHAGAERAETPSSSTLVASDAVPVERVPARRPTFAPVAPQPQAAATAILIRGSAHPALPPLHVVPRRSGPRSPAAQFVGGLVATMAVLSVLALGTPLGRTAGLGDAFQTYASALPWVPTPTPTPRPVAQSPSYVSPPLGANPGTQAIVDEISTVFGANAQAALAVAHCESGYDPNAWNPFAIGNSHAAGVFQILYPSTWDGTSYASLSPFNANANIHAAYQLFSRDGYTWREWQCQP